MLGLKEMLIGFLGKSLAIQKEHDEEEEHVIQQQVLRNAQGFYSDHDKISQYSGLILLGILVLLVLFFKRAVNVTTEWDSSRYAMRIKVHPNVDVDHAPNYIAITNTSIVSVIQAHESKTSQKETKTITMIRKPLIEKPPTRRTATKQVSNRSKSPILRAVLEKTVQKKVVIPHGERNGDDQHGNIEQNKSSNNNNNEEEEEEEDDDENEDDDDEVKQILKRKNTNIAVVGGCGHIGSEVMRMLVGLGYNVICIDRSDPLPHRKVDGAHYVILDVSLCSESQLISELGSVKIVCHLVGFANFSNNVKLHHNLTYYSTLRVLCAAQQAGVQSFISASSLTVIHDGMRNRNAVPPDADYVDLNTAPPFTKFHLLAEKYVLAAGTANPEKFRTCVLRFPAVYGWKDNNICHVMLEKAWPIVHSDSEVRMDFLFTRNAAHSFCCAVQTLSDDKLWIRAFGRAFNITQSNAGETWGVAEFWSKARLAMGIRRPFIQLPVMLCYAVAMLLESIYWILGGIAPFQLSPIWSITRSFLQLITHDFTFAGQKEAFQGIGYRPLYKNDESFEELADIYKEEEERRTRELKSTVSLSVARMIRLRMIQQASGAGPSRNPLLDIDWTPRTFENRPFLEVINGIFCGPGMGLMEAIVVYTTTFFSCMFGILQIQPGWSIAQQIYCVLFCGFNIGGSVQSMTPSSKRWFHLEGDISEAMTYIVILDVLFNCLGTPFMYLDYNSLEFRRYLLFSIPIMLYGTLTVRLCPLQIQRSYGTAYFLFCTGLMYTIPIIPTIKGMEYAIPIIALRVFVCHLPRHEPYR